jgi:hypothetical protein
MGRTLLVLVALGWLAWVTTSPRYWSPGRLRRPRPGPLPSFSGARLNVLPSRPRIVSPKQTEGTWDAHDFLSRL